jgi:hypothetical protein
MEGTIMEINERQPFESFLSPRQLTELKILSIKTNIAFHELLAMPSIVSLLEKLNNTTELNNELNKEMILRNKVFINKNKAVLKKTQKALDQLG